MRLTLIIPAFNSAATIRRCLDSIYALPLPEEEFEVIVVNDASKDETGEIVEEYSKAHENLTQIRHLVNRNVGAARNTGMAAARGKYIAFVDSDDEVGLGVVTALKRMEKDNLDMIAMRVERYTSEGELMDTKSLQIPVEQVFSGAWFQSNFPFWNSGVTSYLFSRVLLERANYPFAENAYYEDADFVCVHLLNAKSMSYCDDCGSRIYDTSSSITHTFSYKHAFGFAFLGTRMLSSYERLENQSNAFAQTILEGGSWNIKQAFRYLLRLRSIVDVHAFYNLLDSRINRSSLMQYRKPTYCWTWWTRLGVKHRYWTAILAGVGIQILRLRSKVILSHNHA